NGIKEENPEIWTEEFKAECVGLIDQAVNYEIAYAKDCLPNGVLGLNSEAFDEYVKYIANRRLERVGLGEQYQGARNPFPWMSEVIDLAKEKNFFESRVTEYQSSGNLEW
ncbi:MAG: ribonucleotide-diphosphate reductase subunit beta, partial [Phycisphaeraceae bacterium]